MMHARRVFALIVLPIVALLLAQYVARDSQCFARTEITRGIDAIVAIAKIAALVSGAVFASQCARLIGTDNGVGKAWRLLSLWQGAYACGQVLLSYYPFVLHKPAIPPTPGDAFFFLGYAFVIVALVQFIRAYQETGFALGRIREHAVFLLAPSFAFAIAFIFVLLPIARGHDPIGAILVNVGYPLADLVICLPAVLLLRMTMRFRGGRLWEVWATILGGILFGAAGDVVFAYVSTNDAKSIAPLEDLFFVLCYALPAYGSYVQKKVVST
jgi:hypothetical protein